MIRRYPELEEQERVLRSPAVTSRLTGMPRSGIKSDPTAVTALKEIPEINKKEMNAVRYAIQEAAACADGSERLEMVRLVFWQKTHTVAGAAMQLHRSERTIREWHRQFIRAVAKNFGLLQ